MTSGKLDIAYYRTSIVYPIADGINCVDVSAGDLTVCGTTVGPL